MRTRLSERVLPNYSRGEEIFNMVSHIVGAVFGFVALISCVTVAALNQNIPGIASGAVYGMLMIVLFTTSSIYHGLLSEIPKKVFQVIDHCSVFLLIAGTYTPLTMCKMRVEHPAAAWSVFGVVWGFTVLGIVLNAIDLKQFRIFSMICYLATGWSIIVTIKPLLDVLETNGVILLFAGGFFYTLGAVLYNIGKKKKFFHSVFHVFVVAGCILQYLCIVLYVLPYN
ncbi:MAG TPA: hemolysin III family channel protein [Ruminococcaceae bacterium]|nr:hemolysin III family channel protein [Oscillospiraceae bacterium]